MSWRLLRTWSDPEMQRKALWVGDMMDASQASADAIGVSRQAIVGQAALETGWGKSLVGTHNLFGIKATPDWKGLRVLVHTREVLGGRSVMLDDWFRDYPSFAESIADHLSFLQANSRYRAAGVFDRRGDQAYFEALQRAGYATDPRYAVNLLAMRDTINTYFLRFMAEDSAAPPAPVVVDAPSPRTWLMVGMHGAAVLELQDRLTAWGYSPGTVDGWFGEKTRAAVARFQKDNHLPDVDGVVGTQTWAAIDKRLAA